MAKVRLIEALKSWIPSREAFHVEKAIKDGRDITLKHAMIRGYSVWLFHKDTGESQMWDFRKVAWN